MRRTLKTAGRQYERGTIAVETAIVLPILLLFFGLPSVLYAFYFRQYTAVQKAAHDAAIYLSTAPRLEMTTAGPDGNFAALTLAKRIIARELAGIVPDGTPVDPIFTCYYRVSSAPKGNACTPQILNLPNYTLFQFDVALNVPFVNPVTGRTDVTSYMAPVVTVRYVGN
jgi:Flp pilus assembly protein TadG